jgi:hypothetical protein
MQGECYNNTKIKDIIGGVGILTIPKLQNKSEC